MESPVGDSVQLDGVHTVHLMNAKQHASAADFWSSQGVLDSSRFLLSSTP